MYEKKLTFLIKKILEEDTSKSYKIKEIEQLLKLGKHKYKNLIDTLFGMVREKQIIQRGRKYQGIRAGKPVILTGIFDARSLAKNKSYAFVETEKGDVFVSSEDTLNAYHEDKVEIELKYSRDHRRYGIIRSVISRNRDEFVGKIEKYQGRYYLVPDNTRIHTNFIINELNSAEPGLKAVIKISNWGSREEYRLPAGNITEIIGKAGDPEVEILSVIRHFNLPLEFPTEVIRELESINEEMTENDTKDRQDLRNIPTITIDPVSAKDYDDAISYIVTDNKIKLYVHIADVSHYVKPELKLFEEAVKRGNSYYFPKMVIPMLPEKLSNKVCSLRPDEDKLTMTVETVFDSDFHMISQQAYQSIIKSDGRFNYDEIDDLFEGRNNEIKTELAEMLRNMLTLSRELDRKRIKRGYIKLNLPETEFIFNDEGIVIDLKRSNETESHVLIENFMLLANEFVAQKLSDKPTLYRIHEYPDEDKILSLQEILNNYNIHLTDLNDLHHSLQKVLAEMKDENYHRVFDKIILRSFRKARYSTENPGHFGLAMDTYTHFTSPIRRICDLIVHLQLKDRLAGKPDRFTRGELENYAEKASECEKVADESEREVEIKNKLNFMKKQIGEEFTGIIVGVQSSSLFVELDSLPVSGRVELSSLKDDYYEYFEKHQEIVGKRYGKIYKLTDPVRVMISKIDDDIYLNILKNK